MKTTLDLPNDLVIEIKLKAAREQRKMKDVAAEALRLGLKNQTQGNDHIEKQSLIQKKLAALARLKPVDQDQTKALKRYLSDYREDRENAFDRSPS